MFIVFDGIDRAGKSTHLKIIASWLKGLGVDFELSREPGGTPVAEKIRKLLIAAKEKAPLDPVMQLLLFSAARFELSKHFAEIKRGNPKKLILCDRYFDSTYAYQGQFFEDAVIDQVIKLSVNVVPDFVFLFLNRYGQDKDSMDKFATQHRNEIISRFEQRASLHPDRYFIVPHGHLKKQQVIIKDVLSKLLNINLPKQNEENGK